MEKDLEHVCEQVAKDLMSHKKVLLFTGEGISPLGKDSINTLFNSRSIKGLDKSDKYSLYEQIGELYRLNIFDKLITQNIDNLHIKSGISEEDLLEYHGNHMRFQCANCDKIFSLENIDWQSQSNQVCDVCDGYLVSSIIDFGSEIDPKFDVIGRKLAFDADICLVLGSDLSVNPSSSYPRIVALRKKTLIIINEGETNLDSLASIKIEEKCENVLPVIVGYIRDNS